MGNTIFSLELLARIAALTAPVGPRGDRIVFCLYCPSLCAASSCHLLVRHQLRAVSGMHGYLPSQVGLACSRLTVTSEIAWMVVDGTAIVATWLLVRRAYSVTGRHSAYACSSQYKTLSTVTLGRSLR